MSVPVLNIRPGPIGFDVIVDPPAPWARHDCLGLATHHAAKRAADALRAVHGWRIADETPSELRGAA